MKISIKKDSNFDEIKYFLVNEFPRVRFWEISENILLAEKNKLVGCYIISSSKSIRIISGFPNIKTNIVAIILVVLGGFIIPIALYFLFLQKSHKLFEKRIGKVVANKYS